MFYLCSIGSNLDPQSHVSNAIAELLTRFTHLLLSSVIQTTPVGMHSCHDFLNCLFIIESELESARLKQEFVAMEVAHGRDRSDPLSKVHDRSLDIDILAYNACNDFRQICVESYLRELLTELYDGGHVQAHKVILLLPIPLQHDQQRGLPQVGFAPLDLQLASDNRQCPPAINPDTGASHINIGH